MIVHTPNINSKTIVSVFNDAELNIKLPTGPGSIRSGCIVAFGDTVPILELSFVFILSNGILSSTSITSVALSFIHSLDACCSTSRFARLCLFQFLFVEKGRKLIPARASEREREEEKEKKRVHNNSKQYYCESDIVQSFWCGKWIMFDAQFLLIVSQTLYSAYKSNTNNYAAIMYYYTYCVGRTYELWQQLKCFATYK